MAYNSRPAVPATAASLQTLLLKRCWNQPAVAVGFFPHGMCNANVAQAFCWQCLIISTFHVDNDLFDDVFPFVVFFRVSQSVLLVKWNRLLNCTRSLSDRSISLSYFIVLVHWSFSKWELFSISCVDRKGITGFDIERDSSPTIFSL